MPSRAMKDEMCMAMGDPGVCRERRGMFPSLLEPGSKLKIWGGLQNSTASLYPLLQVLGSLGHARCTRLDPMLDSCQTAAAQMSSGTELGSPSAFPSLVLRDAAGQSWGLRGTRSRRAPDPAAPAAPRGQTPSGQGEGIGRRGEEGPGAGRGCEPLAAPTGVGSALRPGRSEGCSTSGGGCTGGERGQGASLCLPARGAGVGGRGRAGGGARPAPTAAIQKGPGGRRSGVCRRAGPGRGSDKDKDRDRQGRGRAGRSGRSSGPLRSAVPAAAPSHRIPSHPSHPAPPPPGRDHAAGAGAAPPRSAARLPLPGDAAGPRRRQGCLLPPRRPPAIRRQVQPLHGRLQPAARPRQARGQAQVSDPRPRPRNPSGEHRELQTPGSEPGLHRASLAGNSPRAPGTRLGSTGSIPGGRGCRGDPTPAADLGCLPPGSAAGVPGWAGFPGYLPRASLALSSARE